MNFICIGSLADPGGHSPPSNGTQFIRFHIHFHQKAPLSEVGAPPPQREILDPPLLGHVGLSLCNFAVRVIHIVDKISPNHNFSRNNHD